MPACYWTAGGGQNEANGDENAKCSGVPFAPAVKGRGEGRPKRTLHVLPSSPYRQS